MFTAWILHATERLKPILIKILPINFLRGIKKKMILRAAAKLHTNDTVSLNLSTHPDGVNLIGFIRGEIGLGQSCRLLAWQLEGTNLPFTIYNYKQISAMRHGDHSWDHKITDTFPYNINLIHINPYELPLAMVQMRQEFPQDRYTIGFWLWELEKFPDEWLWALDLVHEIWTPSEFVSKSIRRETQKPVITIPYAIQAPTDSSSGRKSFGLPENTFLVLFMYDCNSSMARKNPQGAIAACKKAFRNDDNVELVIKVNNPTNEDLQQLRREMTGISNVTLIAEVLDKPRVNALIACVDVYISLHRSEGFGLVPAEAMLLGTPVIATNWSANTEFMNPDVACMVDYTFTIIDRDYGQYKKGNRWADPDINQAANYLHRLYTDKDYYNSIAEKAKAHIQTVLSREQAAEKINRRIAEIYREQKR